MLFADIRKKLGSFRLNVTFNADNDVTGILGASGCGKSMTLRCIAGIDKPDEGRIVLDGVTLFDSGRKINLPPQRRAVGYLFQQYALFPNMTVEQNILCGLYHEKDTMKRNHTLAEIISLLELNGLEKRRPSQLSGGQQQRTALARILVNKPKLLMLDEPFAALDSHLRGQIQIRMKRLLEHYGGAVLMVTHNRDEARKLCGKIAVMDTGSLLAPRPPAALFADPGSIAAAEITGCKNIAAAVKSGEYEAEVPGWGLRLQTAQPLRDGLRAIGIRAHHLDPAIARNRFPIRVIDELEELFEYAVLFRYTHQTEAAADIWYIVPKDHKNRPRPAALGVAPEDVLPLY